MYKQLDLFESFAGEEEQQSDPAKKTMSRGAPARDSSEEELKENILRDLPAEIVPAFSQDSPQKTTSPQKGKRGRKSIREMDAESAFINIPDDEVLFKKQYYGIGEVAEMFHLNASLLRYWTNEFDILKPRKNRKGDRLFRPEDIKNLLLIHHLLRQRKYTIGGAKDYLRKNKLKVQQDFDLIQRLEKVKGFLLGLKADL